MQIDERDGGEERAWTPLLGPTDDSCADRPQDRDGGRVCLRAFVGGAHHGGEEKRDEGPIVDLFASRVDVDEGVQGVVQRERIWIRLDRLRGRCIRRRQLLPAPDLRAAPDAPSFGAGLGSSAGTAASLPESMASTVIPAAVARRIASMPDGRRCFTT